MGLVQAGSPETQFWKTAMLNRMPEIFFFGKLKGKSLDVGLPVKKA